MNINMQASADAAEALAEDIGGGDISAELVAADVPATGVLYSRETAVLCGRAWLEACFLHLDKAARFVWQINEGEELSADAVVCEVCANWRALLSGERAALNFLQTLSATATAARRQQQLAGAVKITDTRKTLPKLRVAQKYAVRIGGAHNHRHGLFDEILIKENHAVGGGGIAAALCRARQLIDENRIQTEVRDLAELDVALEAGARRILLDNFSIDDLRRAVQQTDGRAELEASGNIGEDRLPEVAATGVQRISIGGMTKNVRAVDFSFIIKV